MHKSIFVSSTFRDFQTERNLIQNQVELQVNERLREIRVSFVDLRWGIDTTNESGLDKVVSICIEEVLNSYPYYIIMLGDTYGSYVDREVVKPLYAMNGMEYDGRGKSVTEIEIEATGLFRGNNDYVLVLDRHTGASDPSPEAALLKRKVLEAALPENVYTYEATIADQGEMVLKKPSAFVDFIAGRIVEFLSNSENEERLPHLLRAEEENNGFVGRQALIQTLEQRLTDHRGDPFFRIYGQRGSGRTAVMAKLYGLLRQREGCCAAFVTDCDDGRRSTWHSVLADIGLQLQMGKVPPHALLQALDPEKRYYFFVDDFLGFDKSPFLANLIQRKFVQENVVFVVLTEDPEQAHFHLGTLEKEDAARIFRQTLASYKKQLPEAFGAYFDGHITEEMVASPVLLKHFISDLCYLEEDDYRRLSESPDFMAGLTALFIEKMEAFPKTEADYISGNCGDRDDPVRWMLGLLALTQYGIDERTLIGTLRSGGIQCPDYGFYLLKEKFREGIRRKENGDYYITHSSLRREICGLFTREEQLWLRYLYAGYLSENQAMLSQTYCFREVAFQYMAAEDDQLLAGMIDVVYTMPDNGKELGNIFTILCGDYRENRPSTWYQKLVDRKDYRVCCWLVRFGMPGLTKKYIQNAELMFRKMHDTVQTALVKNRWSDDIFSLYLRSLTMNLKFREAMANITAMVEQDRLYGMPSQMIMEMLRCYCFYYDMNNVRSTLQLLLEKMDRSAAGLMSFLEDMLSCLVLLDGNLASIREELEQLFQVIWEKLPEQRDNEHIASLAVSVEYICGLTGITPPIPLLELEKLYLEGERFEGTLSYQLLKGFIQYGWVGDEKEREHSAEVIRQYIRHRIPVDTMDLMYLAKYFRLLCYHYPGSFEREFVAAGTMDLFDRLLSISETDTSAMQLVELSYLCYLGSLYGYGTEWERKWRDQLLRLIRGAGKRANILLEELSFFEQDIAEVTEHLGPECSRVLGRIRRILERHMPAK